jgi:hypothetical protein
MLFGNAVEQFREFPQTQGHSGLLAWVGPDDVAFWFGELLIRCPSQEPIRSEERGDEPNTRLSCAYFTCGVATSLSNAQHHSVGSIEGL